MKDKYTSAMDRIHAGQELLDRTAAYLKTETRRRGVVQKRIARVRPVAMMMAVLLLLVTGGGFAHTLYYAPSAYIGVDVNPSVELTVNRFGRVIRLDAYGRDASDLFTADDVRDKPYAAAVNGLLDTLIAEGYLSAQGLVSVTVQANQNEETLLRTLEAVVSDSLKDHSANAAIEVYGVSQEIRESAQENHVSPAKYIAITELQAVDDSATFESCRGHSVGEIRSMAAGRMQHRHRHGHGGDGMR